MSSERQTGRTYRAVEEAVEAAREGKIAAFVVRNHAMRLYVLRMIAEHFKGGLTDWSDKYRFFASYGVGRVKVVVAGRGEEALRGVKIDRLIVDHDAEDVVWSEPPTTEAELFARRFQHRVKFGHG